MKISGEQTKYVLALIAKTKADEIDCDDCFKHIAEFVECELAGVELSDAMQRVVRHLSQCECCDDEHDALMGALKSLLSSSLEGS